uniref:RING-type E3 ubiquitin transferase n=1 Tax=Aquila chrysaetos chrysaetos TaxID=223781 RepID=A0A663FH98_AQUCH
MDEHVESMAAEPDNRCPICLDSWEEASFAMPCLHQFCYQCILWWAESKPECPCHGASPSGLAEPRRPALTTVGLDLCSLSAPLPRAQRHGSW